MARVTMFVLNDCRSDTRVLREAAALTAAGHAVSIMARPTDPLATTGDGESRDGFRIIRVPIPGRLRRAGLARAAPAGASVGSPACRRGVSVPLAGPAVDGLAWLVRWRLGVEAWCSAAAAAAPPADVWHAHDLNTLPAADRAARARGGAVVYDSHEVFLEAGANARRPAWARRVLAGRERRMARRAARIITVNDEIADLFAARWQVARPTVVMNCSPAWTPPQPPPDRLREAVGLAAGTPLVLYHGALLADRGLPQTIDALARPELAGVHLVLLGDGPLAPRLRDLAATPSVAGRVHLLPPVPPDALPPWVASADVGVMANQPSNANERLSTPNKLFEALAAGLPVVSSDFPARRHILLDDPLGPLGAVCDPTDPAALAGALAGVLGLDASARAALRQRVLEAAHTRYTWDRQAANLVGVYAGLTGRAA
ncbi:MAG TPA: glycosyltransferase family 4 protein [Candidatus Sulfotelmatobacter sp.]|nr:glycosyltransferase family 4 protein [Candidatus Sulfotelmatobacter sp.]